MLRILAMLAVAGVAIVAYEGALRCLPFAIEAAENQWLENDITAERFLLKQPEISTVLVGSSLSKTLPQRYLGEIYNLSFRGGSPIDGMEIIHRTEVYPRKVIIELNCLYRESTGANSAQDVGSCRFALKQNLLCFRSEYRPSNVLFAAMRHKAGRTETQRLSGGEAPRADVYDLLVQESLSGFASAPDIDVAFLDRFMAACTLRHVEVYFLLFPLDPILADTACQSRAREIPLRYPQARVITYDGSPLQTTDGMHLAYADAVKFAEFICSEIEQQTTGPKNPHE